MCKEVDHDLIEQVAIAERHEGDAALDQKALYGVSGDYNADRAVRPALSPAPALGDFAVQRTAYIGAMGVLRCRPLCLVYALTAPFCGATRSTTPRPISVTVMKNLQNKQNYFLHVLAAHNEVNESGDASDTAGPARST